MKRIHLYLLTCFIFVACAEDKPNLEDFQLDEIHHSENYVFNINTTRSVGNILLKPLPEQSMQIHLQKLER